MVFIIVAAIMGRNWVVFHLPLSWRGFLMPPEVLLLKTCLLPHQQPCRDEAAPSLICLKQSCPQLCCFYHVRKYLQLHSQWSNSRQCSAEFSDLIVEGQTWSSLGHSRCLWHLCHFGILDCWKYGGNYYSKFHKKRNVFYKYLNVLHIKKETSG